VLKNKVSFIVLCILALGVFAATAFAARASVQVSLKMNQTAFQSDENIPVTISFTNTSKREVRILRYMTPVDGIKDDLFQVTLDGKAVEYIGADYKRPAPVDTDYITLKSGETLESKVDISGVYDFSQTGSYQISYRAESDNMFSKESSRSNSLQSDGLETWIEGRETKVIEDFAPDAVSGSTSYTSCSTSRQSSLATARNNASTYASAAYNYLNAGTQGSRYTTWFGTYNASRYSTVKSHYLNIRNAMDTASVRFNCSCTDSAYAYVYPTQPYTIYLCNAFWSAPSTGTDSKAGTLVHEMSHFNIVAATDDWAYGQTAAKNLARTNTTRAVDNADSHEYFAENTPSLP
jgi:peptidyl-Lys metalloendopeptidase